MKRIVCLLLIWPTLSFAAADNARRAPGARPALDDFFTLYQPFVGNISAYDPIYFLVGSDPEDSKFQISFKYRFFDAKHPLGIRCPWLQGLNLGYTQTSYWDLEAKSAPFEDNSYKPELFFLSDSILPHASKTRGLFVQTGLKHESNGRSGDESRSTNTAYVKPILILYNPASRLGVHLAPGIAAYFNNEDEYNPDLPAYRGNVELELKVGWAEGVVMSSSVRLAQKGASLAVDTTFPLRRFWSGAAGLYLQLQYVDALAESLIDYKKRTQAVRFGFSIVR